MAKERRVAFGVFIVTILVISIILLATSIKKLEANEQAIMYDTVANKILGRNSQGLYAGKWCDIIIIAALRLPASCIMRFASC